MKAHKAEAMTNNTQSIDRVEFCPMSRQELLSVISKVSVDVPSPTVLFGLNNTLHDLRMGAFKNLACGTCKKDHRDCPGHFGHCTLSAPVLNPSFVKTLFVTTLKTFCGRCFCILQKNCKCKRKDRVRYNKCSRLHFVSANLNKKRKSQELASTQDGVSLEHARKKTCAERCKTSSDDTNLLDGTKSELLNSLADSAVMRSGMKTIIRETGSNRIVSLSEIYTFVASIPKEEYLEIFKGFEKYENLADALFIHVLPILPTSGRCPSMMKSLWYPHSLTVLYTQILKKNVQLKNALMQKMHQTLIDEYICELQDAVNVLFDVNNTTKSLRKSIVDAGGIRQGIDGKKGRVRSNLMGKRVEFCARTVLSGDPNLSINEVGLPRSICNHLTVPERVTSFNIKNMSSWNVRYVIKDKSGTRFDASLFAPGRLQSMICIGDVIERSLMNGDLVVVNRQPSLHRASMNAMYVRIVDCDTLRLNYSAMTGLNADTDGDELNIHVPQDVESRAELEELMLMSSNIVSSQCSKPILGLTQDSLLGVYLLSQAFLSETDFMNLAYQAGLDCDPRVWGDAGIPTVLKPEPIYTGAQLLDCILRELNIDFGRDGYNRKGVLIRNGQLYHAFLGKSTLGVSEHSLIHEIVLRYGHRIGARFMFLIQKAADHFLMLDGFSVGIGDCVVDHEPLNFEGLDDYLLQEITERGKLPDEPALAQTLQTLTLLQPPGQARCQFFDAQESKNCLDKSLDNDVEGSGVSNSRDNRLLDMINSGSKGSLHNYNQITRMVGQQFSSTGRIEPEFARNTRVMPHFTRFDYSLKGRGFVQSSFAKGLSPIEFWMHAVPSRVTMIDTSCKTSVTGAQQRRLVKSLERAIVKEGGDGQRLVCDMVTGNVIQFNYGEDDLDGTYMHTLS